MSFAVRLVLFAVAFVATAASAREFPQFDAEPLKRGRAVWIGTCKDCHANADADAPQALDRKAWQPRLAKGAAALYRSALGGFSGPAGTEMPARGGNPALTEDEVKAAVDYMMKLATQP